MFTIRVILDKKESRVKILIVEIRIPANTDSSHDELWSARAIDFLIPPVALFSLQREP